MRAIEILKEEVRLEYNDHLVLSEKSVINVTRFIQQEKFDAKFKHLGVSSELKIKQELYARLMEENFYFDF